MSKRFVIEGTWSGYTASQRRVVHRTVHKSSPKLRAWAEKKDNIRFSDGTYLLISVRDCLPRERVSQIHGYDSMIMDAFYDSLRRVQS